MNNYVTGNVIKKLRENQNMTQKELAEKLAVSDKTISKWETGRGLPDITLLEPLAAALNLSITELISGEIIGNTNRHANIMKSKLYVCPICGNIINSIGESMISCCGVTLPPLEPEDMDTNHEINIERIENEYFVTIKHEMTKQHYISFIAYATCDKLELIKLYPEGNAESRFPIKGHGIIYAYCNRNGLFAKRV